MEHPEEAADILSRMPPEQGKTWLCTIESQNTCQKNTQATRKNGTIDAASLECLLLNGQRKWYPKKKMTWQDKGFTNEIGKIMTEIVLEQVSLRSTTTIRF